MEPPDHRIHREGADLKALFELSGDLLCVAGVDGYFHRVNPAFTRVLGHTPDELTSQAFVELVHPDDVQPTIAAVESLGDGCEVVGFENRYRCKDGSYRLLQWTAMPQGGRIFAVARDMTEQRAEESRHREQLEAALCEAKAATRAKSEFLATMSHEIRTPMNGILGLCELVLASELSSEQRDDVATIRSSADALLTILNDILDFSKIEAGRLEFEALDYDARRLVHDVVHLLSARAQEKGITLSYTYAEDAPSLFIGDPNRVRQVLLNLVGNAVKFTASGGVHIDVTADAPREGASRVRVTVADTGIGIAPEAQMRLFSRFMQAESSMTRRFGGTGLGLAIARRLVELMGGVLRFESEVGQGSRFTFELPMPLAPQRTTDGSVWHPDEAGPLEHFGARVLLVDDNRVNRKVAQRMFERLGCQVEEAHDGVEAVAKAGGGGFAIVFMDCQMPEMDGFEATTRLRAQGVRTPIVAMTANALVGDRERCLAAGMDDYLTKPVKLAALRGTLRRWLRAAGEGRAAA